MNEHIPTSTKGRQSSLPSASKGTRTSTFPLSRRAKGPTSSDGTNGSIIAKKPSAMTLSTEHIVKNYLRVLIILLILPLVTCEDINITCGVDVPLTSPGYPLTNYPNNVNKQWNITVPYGRRILVTFNDFSVQKSFDYLDLYDAVQRKDTLYTGENMEFSPFLSKGNELDITFISSPRDTRKGFSISISCYVKSGASMARVEGGRTPAEGFLKLRTQSQEWRRVCQDNFTNRVAEVVCGELGYPGVKDILFENEETHSCEKNCIKPPNCGDYTYRLEDCAFTTGNCTSAHAVEVHCWEPGYEACYDSDYLRPQNGSTFTSLSECVSSCRTEKQDALAIISNTSCFCSTTDEIKLSELTPDNDCNRHGDEQQAVNLLVYNASVGFCHPLEAINGYWDSNITWFGSIVHLTCDDGYTLDGNKTLQCVPGVSPYIPDWNYSPPLCEMTEETTGAPQNHRHRLNNAVVAAPSSIAIIFVGILCFMISQYSLIATTFTMPGRRKMGLIRRCKTHFTKGNDGTEDSSGYTALPHRHDGISQTDTLQLESQLHLPSSQDSVSSTSTPFTSFPLLQSANMQNGNHYRSSDNDSDPYHYATSLGIPSFSSVRGNHPHLRQSETNITENAYELSDNATDPSTSSDHQPEMVPMFNRPLPHRPISLDIHEGPSLPPRERPGTHSLTNSTGLSSGHDQNGACASDYNSLTDDVIFKSRRTLNDSPLPHDREETPSKDARAQHDGVNCSSTEASARTSEYHGYYSADELEDENTFNDNTVSFPLLFSKLDPFYHVLEHGQPQMRNNDPAGSGIGFKKESEHRENNNQGNYLTDVMIENVLYNPLKS